MSDLDQIRFDAEDLRLFAPPGTVDVSLAALDLARKLLGAARVREQGDWIPVFDWAHTSVRERPDAEMREIGWGVGLGASKRREIPGQMIHRLNGVEFAVQIPADALAQSKQRLIDVEPTAFLA